MKENGMASNQNKFNSLHICVEYKEFEPETYEGVSVSALDSYKNTQGNIVYTDKEVFRSNSGNYEYDRKVAEQFVKDWGVVRILNSSVEHYKIDCKDTR